MADAVIQPLEVFILDANFNRLTGSIPYDSLMWHRRYYGVGEFQMQVRSSLYDPSWCYVYADDRPETGIIQKVEFDDTTEGPANGEDTIIISGFFLEEILNRLVFLIEESETQETKHIVPKPTRGSFPTPTYYTDEDGNYYVKYNGGQWNNCMTGEGYRYESDPDFFDGLTEADVEPGKGMSQTTFIYDDGSKWTSSMWSTSYSYVSEDGKLSVINGRDNTVGEYEIVGDPSSGNILYKDTDGSVKWVNGAVESFNDTYRRKTQRWESLAVDEDGNHYYMEYREVEGPWMLRTDIDDVNSPQDNVQWILKMAEKVFQGNFIYDKVDFEGETKTLTPSLTKIGDYFYQELESVEASLRVLYYFESNQMVLQLWRGLDRTQDNGGQTPAETAAPMALSVLSDAPVLPSGYTELEYIQGSGTQYINTGFNPDNNTRLVVDFETMSAQTDKHFFGCRVAMNNTSFCFVDTTDGDFRNDYARLQYTFPSNTNEVGRYTFDMNKNVTTFGEQSHTFAASTFSIDYPIFLCAINTGGSRSTTSSMRIYSCQIYDNGTQVRSFVPAKRDSDSVVGLYDTIGQSFYTNAGTGTFTAGPVVEYADSLTYMPNGGSGSMDPTEGYVGDSVTVSANGFTYADHTFVTWNTAADGSGVDYAPLSQYVLTAGADVLYAQWQEVSPGPEPVPGGVGAPWAVFSDTWGTLYGYRASHDESNYRNKCYILYDYEEPVWDSTGHVAVIEVAEYDDKQVPGTIPIPTGYHYEVRSTTKRGYLTVRMEDDRPDAEVWMDRRSDYPDFMDGFEAGEVEEGTTYDFTKADFDAWVESLKTDAEVMLKNDYSDVDNLDTGTISTMRYLYDYDLGDKVDMAVEAIGMVKTARITEVEEVYESGSAEIHLTMGEELLTTSKKSTLV